MKHFYTKILLICIASCFASEVFCMRGSRLRGFFANGGRIKSEQEYQAEQAAQERQAELKKMMRRQWDDDADARECQEEMEKLRKAEAAQREIALEKKRAAEANRRAREAKRKQAEVERNASVIQLGEEVLAAQQKLKETQEALAAALGRNGMKQGAQEQTAMNLAAINLATLNQRAPVASSATRKRKAPEAPSVGNARGGVIPASIPFDPAAHFSSNPSSLPLGRPHKVARR